MELQFLLHFRNWTVLWGDFGVLFYTIGEIMLVWTLLYYMYKKNIFLRV